MKIKQLGYTLILGLMMSPLLVQAGVSGGNANSNWSIYAWQNWAGEFVEADVASIDPADADGTRERDSFRMQNNAANLGFAANIDTGLAIGGQAVKATFQCEQFTFFNRFSGSSSNLCNRNSKLGLAGVWGEVMFSQQLTPYNQMTAAWLDPFYDAGTNTHSTNMGLGGFGIAYGNGGFDAAGMSNQGFMRRKPELWQWHSPNWNGLTASVGWSNDNVAGGGGENQVTTGLGTVEELDPSILSIGVAYTKDIGNDNLWLGFGYQQHDEWAAVDFACDDSDDDTWRLGARYIHDWAGSGHATTLSLGYEESQYEWDNCADAGGLATANSPYDIANSPTGSVDVEMEAWLISGKHNFPGPLDFRFMYTERDDYDCGGPAVANVVTGVIQDCNGSGDSSSGSDQLSLGVYYNFPAGTELNLTWSDLSNDSNSQTDFGIGGVGIVRGGDAEIWSFGMTQWF